MLTDNDYDSGVKMAAGSLQHCTPDYEAMIGRAKERLAREEKMRDALLEYLRSRTVEGKMAEMVGEIVTRCNSLEQEIDGLVDRQDKD